MKYQMSVTVVLTDADRAAICEAQGWTEAELLTQVEQQINRAADVLTIRMAYDARKTLKVRALTASGEIEVGRPEGET